MGVEGGARRYRNFISSKAWREIRLAALAYYGDRCGVCSVGNIQMHHLFYPSNWGETQIEHLIPLCYFHHEACDSLPTKGVCDDESQLDEWRAALVVQLKNFKPKRRKLKEMDRLALDWHAELDRECFLAIEKDRVGDRSTLSILNCAYSRQSLGAFAA